MGAIIFIKVLYAMLLAVFHIGLSNCSISKSSIWPWKSNPKRLVSATANQSTSMNDSITTEKSKKWLVCFDVDGTIVLEHSMQQVSNYAPYIQDRSAWVIFNGNIQPLDNTSKVHPGYDKKNVKSKAQNLGLRDASGLKDLINHLLQRGDTPVITTLNDYPDLVIALLKKVGLTQDQISNMLIIGGWPKEAIIESDAKMKLVKQAMELTGRKKDSAHVILVDDNKDNIDAAAQNGVTGIHVDHKFNWNVVKETIALNTNQASSRAMAMTMEPGSGKKHCETNTLEDKGLLVCFNIDIIMPNRERNFLHNSLKNLNLPSYMEDDSLWVAINGKTYPSDVISKAYANYNKGYSKKEVEKQTRWLLDKLDIKSNDHTRFKNFINGLLQAKYKLVITTFNDYPDSIPILLHTLGLKEDQINNILIIGGHAQKGDNYAKGKMDHIEKVKELTGTTDNANIILIDNNYHNIQVAKKHGIKTFYVSPSPGRLPTIEALEKLMSN